MADQPIWTITVPDEVSLESMEELLSKSASWQIDGTGLQIERLDVIQGSTSVYVSGSEADARALLARIGERVPKAAGRVTHASCSVKDLHRLELPSTSGTSNRRPPGRG